MAGNMGDEWLSKDKISIIKIIMDELAKEQLQKPFNLRNTSGKSQAKKSGEGSKRGYWVYTNPIYN